MSAKKSSQPSKPSPTPTPVAVPTGPESGTATATAPEPAWIESTDPRKRTIAKIVMVGLCLYVAALWLLALDQWFNWGIFGPKIPPIP